MGIDKLLAVLEKEADLKEQALLQQARDESEKIIRSARSRAAAIDLEIGKLKRLAIDRENAYRTAAQRMAQRAEAVYRQSKVVSAVFAECEKMFRGFMVTERYEEFVRDRYSSVRDELGSVKKIVADKVTARTLEKLNVTNVSVDDGVGLGFVAESDDGKTKIFCVFRLSLENYGTTSVHGLPWSSTERSVAMGVEYCVVRLAGMKSRFPSRRTIEDIARTRDISMLVDLLASTIFRDDIAFSIHSGERSDASRILRSLNEGYERLRSIAALKIKNAYPGDYPFFVMRWEVERIKAAIRYLSCGGLALEKRFRFVSYVLQPKVAKKWNAHMGVEEFISFLKHAGHPMAKALDPQTAEKERVNAELEMDKFYFRQALPRYRKLFDRCGYYLSDQIDFINIQNAMLLRANTEVGTDTDIFYIMAHGKINADDFKHISSSTIDEAAIFIGNKFGVDLGSGYGESASELSLKIKKMMLNRLGLRKIGDPTGPFAILEFIESLDAMMADLKTAIYFSAAGAAYEKTKTHFVTVS